VNDARAERYTRKTSKIGSRIGDGEVV